MSLRASHSPPGERDKHLRWQDIDYGMEDTPRTEVVPEVPWSSAVPLRRSSSMSGGRSTGRSRSTSQGPSLLRRAVSEASSTVSSLMSFSTDRPIDKIASWVWVPTTPARNGKKALQKDRDLTKNRLPDASFDDSATNPTERTESLKADTKKRRRCCNMFRPRHFRNLIGAGHKLLGPEYTIASLERTLYDKVHHDSKGQMLQPEGLILVDQDKEIPEWLFRCIGSTCTKSLDLVMLVSVILTSIVSPLTFLWGGNWEQSSLIPGESALLIFDLSMDVLYCGFLFNRLNTSFMHPRRRTEVVDRGAILYRWLTDPLYWVEWASTLVYAPIIVFGIPTLVNAVKFVRMWNFVRTPDSMWRIKEHSKVRTIYPIFILVFISHWLACVLGCVGGYRSALEEGGEAAFRTYFDLPLGVNHSISGYISMYFKAFVEACYLLTGMMDDPVGMDGPRENNFGALVLVTVCGPLGVVGISFFIASVVREQSLKFALDMRHSENQAFIKRALEILNIPSELQRRVYSLHYFQKMSHDKEALAVLFANAASNPPLESALRVYLYHDSVLLSRHFVRKDLNYIIEVVRVLWDRTYLPGDYVTRCGELGDGMYFVARGNLSVLVPTDGSRDVARGIIIAYKTAGDYFGEIALIHHCVRTAWVRADTYVLASMLLRESVEKIWKFFPAEREELMRTVAQHAKTDLVRKAARHEQGEPESLPSDSNLWWKGVVKVSRITGVFGSHRQKTSKPSVSVPSAVSPRSPPSLISSTDSEEVYVASGAAVQVSSNPQTHEESISGIGMETAFPIAPDTVATLLALRNLSSRVLEGQSALHDRIGRLEERLEQLTLPGRSDRCTKRHPMAESRTSNKHVTISRQKFDTFRNSSRSPGLRDAGSCRGRSDIQTPQRHSVLAESPLLPEDPQSLQISFEPRRPFVSGRSEGANCASTRSAPDCLRGSAIPSCPVGSDGAAKLCGSSL